MANTWRKRNRTRTPRLVLWQIRLCCCLAVAMVLMGIGYAAITSVTLDVVGTATVEAGKGVYISSASFDTGYNVDAAEVISFSETTLYTSVEFTNLNPDSYATFDVTLTNDSTEGFIFTRTLFDESFYVDGAGNHNTDIIFDLIGVESGQIIAGGDNLSFKIKFYYQEGVVSQNILKSYLNFAFIEGYSVNYLHMDDTSHYPQYVGAGQNLIVDMSDKAFDVIKVYVDNIETTDFTYVGHVLVVPNVSGNLIIDHPVVLAEDALPSEPVKPEPGTGVQISSGFTSEYLSSETGISQSSMSRFNNITERYDTSTSTYYLTVKKTYKILQSISPDDQDFDLDFNIKNDSASIWTGGNVTVDYVANGDTLSNVTGTISKTVLSPGETAVLNMKFMLRIYGAFWGTSYNEEITYKINYDIDGTVKTMNLVLLFES